MPEASSGGQWVRLWSGRPRQRFSDAERALSQGWIRNSRANGWPDAATAHTAGVRATDGFPRDVHHPGVGYSGVPPVRKLSGDAGCRIPRPTTSQTATSPGSSLRSGLTARRELGERPQHDAGDPARSGAELRFSRALWAAGARGFRRGSHLPGPARCRIHGYPGCRVRSWLLLAPMSFLRCSVAEGKCGVLAEQAATQRRKRSRD